MSRPDWRLTRAEQRLYRLLNVRQSVSYYLGASTRLVTWRWTTGRDYPVCCMSASEWRAIGA